MLGLFFLGIIVSVAVMFLILYVMSKEGEDHNGNEKRL